MTQQEFNEKYKPYLKNGYEGNGLMFDISEVTDYLDKEFQEFIKIPAFFFTQIKFKFGQARFYADNLELEEKLRVESIINDMYDKILQKS